MIMIRMLPRMAPSDNVVYLENIVIKYIALPITIM